MFMDFLKSLSIFGEKAPAERMKELIGIIEGQADLDAQFNVSAYFIVLTMGFVKVVTFEAVHYPMYNNGVDLPGTNAIDVILRKSV
jgi:hypothetical protein